MRVTAATIIIGVGEWAESTDTANNILRKKDWRVYLV